MAVRSTRPDQTERTITLSPRGGPPSAAVVQNVLNVQYGMPRTTRVRERVQGVHEERGYFFVLHLPFA